MFAPEFHSNVAKILRRIEETKAAFKKIPNEDIENARLIKEFCLKHVDAKTHTANLYITLSDLEMQASYYEVGFPESNYR